MNKQQLFENIKRKKSFLCVGLDTDIKRYPIICWMIRIPSSLSIKQSLMQQQTIASLINLIWLSMRAWA